MNPFRSSAFRLLLASLLCALALPSHAADDVIFPGVVQRSAQNLPAPLKAYENADGSRTLGVVQAGSATGNAIAQVTLNSSTATLAAAARTSRTTVLIRNLDASISIYYGTTSGVTTATGMLIKAGESVTKNFTGTIYCIAVSGTPSVAVDDEYH